MRILLAGSTGAIGREIRPLLKAAGYDLACPTRAEGVDALRTETLRGVCDGVAIVVSAIGGSVGLTPGDKRPYAVTNGVANRNLLECAKAAGVRRFVYIAAHSEPSYAASAYMRAHEDVVSAIRASGLSYTILRPTGVFTALAPYVGFARKGFVPLIGDGSAKTNPIHPADVAAAAIENLHEGPESVSLGGPEVLTRRGIAEIAAFATGKQPHYLSAPLWVARLQSRVIGVFDRRMGELIEFAAAVATNDCVAPAHGTQRLLDYFTHLAKT